MSEQLDDFAARGYAIGRTVRRDFGEAGVRHGIIRDVLEDGRINVLSGLQREQWDVSNCRPLTAEEIEERDAEMARQDRQAIRNSRFGRGPKPRSLAIRDYQHDQESRTK